MARSAPRGEGPAPRSRRFIGPHARRVGSRAKALENKLARVLGDMVQDEITDTLRRMKKRRPVQKAKRKRLTPRERQILVLLNRYGLRQAQEGGATIAGGKFIITPTFEAEFLERNRILVQELSANVRDAFREGMQRAMSEWSLETPPPSVGEIARRLRIGQITTPATRSKTDRGFLRPLSNATTIHGLASRARTIARTEIGRARNAGRVQGMKDAGIEYYEWSSASDIHSREGHALMNGQVRAIGKPFKNPVTGALLDSPGDPDAPASETINCRCTLVPALKPRR